MQTPKKIFFLVPFHLSRHETTVFSVTDATKKWEPYLRFCSFF